LKAPPEEDAMAVIDGRTWLEHISPTECWALLSATPVGRIGVLNDSAPEIYPVNHVVDRHTIVFRTDPGSKLRGLLRSPAVCYQIDGINPADATGWSVLVKGRAVGLHHPDELRDATELPLHYWTLGDKAHWIRIVPDEITGRRIWSRTSRSDSAATDPSTEKGDSSPESNEEVRDGPASDEQ
jgi:nitroimidazol reductase NimA-like FMN-containing flavoprotein (pyridoxamine 5'-phosphate oxidase superfamily)